MEAITINKREYANKLALQLKEKYSSSLDIAQDYLMEHLDYLRDYESFAVTNEPFSDLHSFITEVACLLTNPEISSKLSISLQLKAGIMIKKMLWFFERMQDEDMCMLLLHHRLINLSGGADSEELESIAELLSD